VSPENFPIKMQKPQLFAAAFALERGRENEKEENQS
jgi:hypothetical protein